MEEWVFISDVPSEGPSSTDKGEVIPETPSVSAFFFVTLGLRSPMEKHVFGNELRHHCFALPCSNEVILSGYEKLHEILLQHIVDIERESFARHMKENTLPLLT